MSQFIIATDSAADLPQEVIDRFKLPVFPLYYCFGEEVFGGDRKLEPSEFYKKMREGALPTTMATNPQQIEDGLKPYLEQGQDVLYIAFSSGLSSSCQNALIAAEELMRKFPERTVKVVDSLAASMGEGLLVYKACVQKEQGKSLEEIAAWLEDNVLHLCHLFTVDDLNHLYRGGRISKTTAVLGTMINVKPVLHVDDEGKLVAIGKVRGRKKALSNLVERMAEQIKGYEAQNDIVFISHGDCKEDAEFVASMVQERFGIHSFMIDQVSPTIGAHSGPGTIALFFLGSVR